MSQISALKRIQTNKEQQNCEKFNQIILNKDIIQVYIGRDIECNYRISSIEISRKHALIEYSIVDNVWSISDLRSTNGLFVNSTQLSSFSPHRLSNGDRVSFGPPNQSQFNYQFISNYLQNSNTNCVSYELSAINLTTIPVIPIVTRIETNSSDDQILSSSTVRFDIEPNHSSTISVTANMPTRSGANYSLSTSGSRMSVSTTCTTVNTGSNHKKVMSRKSRDNNSDRNTVSGFVEHDYSRSSGTKESDRNGKSSKRLKLKANGSENGLREGKVSDLERKLISHEKEKLAKLKKSLEQLEEKSKSDRLKIKRKEEVLKERQKELEEKEKESKKREQEIEKMRKELIKKRKELNERRNQLSEESVEENSRLSAKRKLRSDSARESTTAKRVCSSGLDVSSQMEELFGTDMTCSICAEYFIHAVNLNCSHTFCFACIEEWKHSSRSGGGECPICREKIETQTRVLIFDNIIDSFVAEYKPQLQEHRNKLVDERKKRLEKRANDSEANSRASNNSRGRFSSLLPSLQFFFRRHPLETNDDSDSDDDSGPEVGIFGLDFGGDSLMNSSSSISSSDESSDSSISSTSSNSSSNDSIVSLHSNRNNSSVREFGSGSLSTRDRDEDFDDDNSRDSDVSLQSSIGSHNSSDSDVESIVEISDAQDVDSDSSDSSDDSDFSVD